MAKGDKLRIYDCKKQVDVPPEEGGGKKRCPIQLIKKDGVHWVCPPTCPRSGASHTEAADYITSLATPFKPVAVQRPRVIDRFGPLLVDSSPLAAK
jgi:hypothetical protein